MSLLAARGVTKRFGGLVALAGVDFDIRAGEIVGLIGQNGAGKTTLINTITGVHRADGGSIVFDGHELTRLPPDRITRLGVARTFQIPQPFASLTVLENVVVSLVFGRQTCPAGDAGPRARPILEAVGLAAKADVRPSELTIVELRRLELARALAAGARLLLLDEINAGLTGAEMQEAIGLVRALRERGITILMVEHVMRIVMRVCERIIVLHFGQKIADGPPEAIARDPRVIEAYLGERRPGAPDAGR